MIMTIMMIINGDLNYICSSYITMISISSGLNLRKSGIQKVAPLSSPPSSYLRHFHQCLSMAFRRPRPSFTLLLCTLLAALTSLQVTDSTRGFFQYHHRFITFIILITLFILIIGIILNFTGSWPAATLAANLTLRTSWSYSCNSPNPPSSHDDDDDRNHDGDGKMNDYEDVNYCQCSGDY